MVLPPRFLPGTISSGRSLALEMLAAGWATTYEQAGAEYGRWGKDAFLRAESIAKWVFTISCNHLAAACLILSSAGCQHYRAAGCGIWEKGVDGETPAEYKRRIPTDPQLRLLIRPLPNKQERRPGEARSQQDGWRRLFSGIDYRDQQTGP